MSKKEIGSIILVYIVWKLAVLSSAYLSQTIFPLQTTFLGGGLLNYLRHTLFWGFINFDGEHYLSIARDGYLSLTYFYFPLFPLIIKLLSNIFGGTFNVYAGMGLIISNVTLMIALIGFYRLGNMMYLNKTSLYSVLLLLLFPTSFFLGAYYNESLFLMLIIWSFYFAFTKKWFYSFLLCGLASATRLVGIALVPALLYEYLITDKNRLLSIKSACYLFLSSAGVIIYSIYLKVTTNDFLAFFHNVEIFGSQRTTNLVVLPQVFYRYFVKILPAVNYTYFPQVFTTWLEIITAVLFLIGAYYVCLYMKKSIFIYYMLTYLIPTLSGSFSSFPRYVLALFPLFLITGKYLSVKSKPFSYTVFSILLLSSFFAISLFIRGYFIS
jgi:Gpi18-like mannosyltransferase